MNTVKLISLLYVLLGVPMSAQVGPAHEIAQRYPEFKHPEITSRQFTHAQLHAWIAPSIDGTKIRKEHLGSSGEGRPIWCYTAGSGKTKVLLWSQMHGDEPTATMALVDILRFLSLMPDHPIARSLMERYTLLMIPMLNPDGAERFTRRTAQLIDMNRDALALQTPEAQLLKAFRDREQPEYGFNLHDQGIHYMVGTSQKHAMIALLAPPFDEERRDNAVRLRAKRLAGMLANIFHEFIPGHVAKWDDTFEPRAFGDNVQRWGTSTVLIESGASPGDTEKMEIRRLNAIAILASLASIPRAADTASLVRTYDELPFNTKAMYDLIIRDATLQASPAAPAIRVDVAINFEDVTDAEGKPRKKASIQDVGDLRVYRGYREENVSGKRLNPAKIRIEAPFLADEMHLLFGN